jgi:hypothetical protein
MRQHAAPASLNQPPGGIFETVGQLAVLHTDARTDACLLLSEVICGPGMRYETPARPAHGVAVATKSYGSWEPRGAART